MRALAVANVASFRDGWAFRKSIAAKIGGSVRTVARAFKQAREEGLMGIARAKAGERPTGADGKPLGALPCGWSHRWTIGWGEAGKAVKVAIANARARFLARAAVKGKSLTPAPARGRWWSAFELDAELERRAAVGRPPPEKPPE